MNQVVKNLSFLLLHQRGRLPQRSWSNFTLWSQLTCVWAGDVCVGRYIMIHMAVPWTCWMTLLLLFLGKDSVAGDTDRWGGWKWTYGRVNALSLRSYNVFVFCDNSIITPMCFTLYIRLVWRITDGVWVWFPYPWVTHLEVQYNAATS